MKLSEIHAHPIFEAEDGAPDLNGKDPIEVADVIKYFPKNYMKVLRVLWGKPRLSYHGMSFFGDGDNAYDKIDAAIKAAIKDGLEVPVSIDVDGTDDLDMDSLNYDAPVSDYQEVYLGYQPSSDSLYVGIDAWLNEEDFNDAWDREFKNQTGESFDMDDEEHAKVFNSAWENYKDSDFYGILFKLSKDLDDVEEVASIPGGFYKGIYRANTLKHLQLVDLRLD
jgi:hypothetical protein